MKVAEEPSWFAGWEEQLPSPEELMPLSQSLITPDLALAFDIPTCNHRHSSSPAAVRPPAAAVQQRHQQIQQQGQGSQQSDFDSGDLGGGGGEEPARTLKRPRLVWTPQLHKRFVEAVAHLGIKNAVPKTIMQLMSVDGLTRENVASHLQKYRLYLKRMQGVGPMGSGAAGGGSGASGPLSAEDQFFASGPLPHQFLTRPGPGPGGGSADPYVPFVSVSALQHHHHIAAAQQQQQQQQQYYHHQRSFGHYGSPQGNGAGYGSPIRAASPALQLLSMAPLPPLSHQASTASSYADDPDSHTGREGERRILTLFPTGDDSA